MINTLWTISPLSVISPKIPRKSIKFYIEWKTAIYADALTRIFRCLAQDNNRECCKPTAAEVCSKSGKNQHNHKKNIPSKSNAPITHTELTSKLNPQRRIIRRVRACVSRFHMVVSSGARWNFSASTRREKLILCVKSMGGMRTR